MKIIIFFILTTEEAAQGKNQNAVTDHNSLLPHTQRQLLMKKVFQGIIQTTVRGIQVKGNRRYRKKTAPEFISGDNEDSGWFLHNGVSLSRK